MEQLRLDGGMIALIVLFSLALVSALIQRWRARREERLCRPYMAHADTFDLTIELEGKRCRFCSSGRVLVARTKRGPRQTVRFRFCAFCRQEQAPVRDGGHERTWSDFVHELTRERERTREALTCDP